MEEVQIVICWVGTITVPIIAFLFGSMVNFWILQVFVMEMQRRHIDDIPNRTMTQMTFMASLGAVPIAAFARMIWNSSNC